MITTAIINLAYFMLNGLISLFPSGTGFSASWHTAAQTLGSYLHVLDPLVDISIFATCVATVFTVELAIFGFRTFKWIIGHIPFLGGKGT